MICLVFGSHYSAKTNSEHVCVAMNKIQLTAREDHLSNNQEPSDRKTVCILLPVRNLEEMSFNKKVSQLHSIGSNDGKRARRTPMDSFGHQCPNHVVGSFKSQCIYFKTKPNLANKSIISLARIERN